MSNDKFQDKYNEVFQSLKEEKMNWDFEDFLQKAESKVDLPIIPIRNEKKSLSKWVWMAACAVVVFGLFLVLNKKYYLYSFNFFRFYILKLI